MDLFLKDLERMQILSIKRRLLCHAAEEDIYK